MRKFLALALLCGAFPLLAAGDWPQFRGPNRDGVSPDKGLLKEWPDGGPKLLWKSDAVGQRGYSSVAVAGDLVVTMGDVSPEGVEPKGKKGGGDSKSTVFAVDRKTGKQKWKFEIGPGGASYPGPRSTPTIDVEGKMVYALSQNGTLVALDFTGKEVWKKDYKKDYSGSAGGWSYAESVLIDGDKLICTPGGKTATLLALDKKTGKEIWKGVVPPNGDTAGYSSVMVSNAGGVKQYVTLLANGLVSFSADGKFLWKYGEEREKFGGNTANIPTAVIDGDKIYITAGYGRGAALLTVSGSGGDVKVKEEYFTKAMTTKHGGVVKVGDYVYGDAGDGGTLCCIEEKTGKVMWKRERGDAGKGGGSCSVCAADGKLYVFWQNGVVGLVEADSKEYKLISHFKLSPKHEAWAHPVVTDGKLFIRLEETVYCYDLKGK